MSRQMYFNLIFVTSLLSMGMLSGCATIVKGTTQKVAISSDPEGADVTVDDKLYGQTPIDVSMKRKRDHLVTISKEGYKPKSIPEVKSVGGAVWGNIIAGGLIGWGIDATSGAQYNLSPESISVELTPINKLDNGNNSNEAVSNFVKELHDLDKLKEEGNITDDEYNSMRTALFKKYYPKMDMKTLGLANNNNNDKPAETEAKSTKKNGDCRVVAEGNTARIECQTN